MPRTFTLGTLVTRCQQRCDKENEDHIGDSEWKGLISSAVAELYDVFAMSGSRYHESTFAFAVAAMSDNGAGGRFIALPDDHLSTLAVTWVSGTRRYPLRELMLQEQHDWSHVSDGQAMAWAMSGNDLHLYPSPKAGQSYELRYVPQPPSLSDAADSTDVEVYTPTGEQFVIEHVAVRALSKEGSDVRGAVAEREAARDRIEAAATRRALLSPRRHMVVDEYEQQHADWLAE